MSRKEIRRVGERSATHRPNRTPPPPSHLASFDCSKRKTPLTGMKAVTGEQCYEGWTLYRFPGPQFAGVDPAGSANHAFYVWVHRTNTLGLG